MKFLNLEIDLRESGQHINSYKEFSQLWAEIEARIKTRILPEDDEPLVEPLKGTGQYVRFRALSRRFAGKSLSGDFALSVSRIIEPDKNPSPCRMCTQEGFNGNGDYSCLQCSGEARYCDRHIREIEGSLRTDGHFKVNCTDHPFNCATCGSSSSFFCFGPTCIGQISHCNSHGRSIPSDSSKSYCLSCAEKVHPTCNIVGCDEPAFSSCEYVDGTTGHVCAQKCCGKHVSRWQIFGPESRGLECCSIHRKAIKLANADEITYLATAGTMVRKRAVQDESEEEKRKFHLPSISRLRFILLKNSARLCTESFAFERYKHLIRTLQNKGDQRATIENSMLRTLESKQDSWGKQIDQVAERRAQGSEYFERLLNVVEANFEVSARELIEFSDFHPARPARDSGEMIPAILRVKVHPDFAGHFKGKKSSRLEVWSEELGIAVRMERRE